MRQISGTISIGKFEFEFAHEIRIRSSWKHLTDTASIALPRALKWKDQYLKDEIKKGDQVRIELGYDFEDQLEFSGYVSEVKSGVPTLIECEDEMWTLKQSNITKTYRSVKLQQLLQDIIPENIKFNAVQADLGPFRINKVSPAKVLDEIKKKYGIVSFFRAGVLVVGFPYSQVERDNYEYQFEKDIISDRLLYKKQDDIKVTVRAVSMLPGGKTITEKVGDPDGELHSLHFYNLSQSQLVKSAKEEMARLRFEGYRGGFNTFGIPHVKHSDQVTLKSYEYPERDGSYLVDEIDVYWGVNGYRRSIVLGPKSA
ncbi:hypothetical protein [Flavilitoribacter nigricans]|uniref:Phage late control D family protein n=1 Tax=Flavilitoribacter nigricans (strain ATCC 23147 / DSM 23189 / NBRC 102662 / NCIMB 1420 / SS-2) TaxID=1122177 RepID=A0A2D0MWJ4_FLAN2|nr:hypothetical protein [Flavilitoribacter nigricans]PHN00634.1 hypothetical protein CRP01_41235 [Flavilitoribacter nigricans DSM 23189 = NBRC 102662]